MGKHINIKQEDMIIEFMEKNPQLAKGFSRGDKVETESLWQTLTDNLNLLGPPMKKKDAWKKAWLDKKSQIKKKISTNKKESRATGGGPYNQLYILNREEAIGNICGLFDVVDGIDDSVACVGQPISTTEILPSTLQIEAENGKANESNCSQPSKRKSATNSLEINLKKFMADETSCYAEISATMVKMLDAVKDKKEISKNIESGITRVYRSLEKMSDSFKEQTRVLNALKAEFANQGTERIRHHKELEKLAYEKNVLKAKILELQKEQIHLLN